MTCRGTIDGRYLSVSMLNRDGRVMVFRGDQLGIFEVDCPGVGGEECPVCGRLEAPWRKGDEPHLAPCELADEDLTYEGIRIRSVFPDNPIARVHRAYDVLGIETVKEVTWPPVD